MHGDQVSPSLYKDCWTASHSSPPVSTHAKTQTPRPGPPGNSNSPLQPENRGNLCSLDQTIYFFHNKRHPTEMAEAEIAQFLSNLATGSHVSASTQNQALNAVLFLYRQVLCRHWLHQGCGSCQQTEETTDGFDTTRSEVDFRKTLMVWSGSWPCCFMERAYD
jgi:Phage integrase, N-terminal SAM-like domain